MKLVFNLNKPDESWSERGLKPDATIPDAVIEIKYTDDFIRSMYNYDRRNPYVDREVEETINQALKYEKGDPPRKLVYYTNDWSFAEYYTRAFRAVKLSNFRFVIVPAVRSIEDGKD